MSYVFKLERNVELSPESKLVAERDLRETPERVKEGLRRIRELLKENPDLYYGDDDYVFTILLRKCKWYPESALALMRRMAEFKREHSHLISGLRPEHIKNFVINHNTSTVLPKRDHKNRRIVVVNGGAIYDPSKADADDLFKEFYLLDVIVMLEPETQVNGIVTILDYHNMGWTQVASVTPSSSKRQVTFLQDASGVRQKEIHVVRQPMIFNILWNILKPFINEKLKKRMFFHGTKFSSFHKYIPAAYLPAEYGGQLPAVDYSGKIIYDMLEQNRDYIETWDSFGFINKT
ncbi:unnamed protein product [Diatraea saccharalis]|uniref:CRAL-TRIO domain-containing protein n=1 Tax=Diatraea saccharalis TaxID=40085 RepID=A0A9N9W879_9NEOP|nr:unnamed protein product [Diatraea saccharalis]